MKTLQTTIAIDPLTRIEGHLKIEAILDGKKVVEVKSEGTSDEYIYPGLIGLINELALERDLKTKFIDSTLMKVLDKLRNHFIVANSEIGLYWRGYKRHAFNYHQDRTPIRFKCFSIF